MYKAIDSIRFVEIVKLSLVLFMYEYKKHLLPFPMKYLFLQHLNRQNILIPIQQRHVI